MDLERGLNEGLEEGGGDMLQGLFTKEKMTNK